MWHRVLPVFLLVAAARAPLPAQAWNDAASRALVERATTRRLAQLADSTLVDYRASARGYLTFLAQLGEGFLLPPRVVKADELALEVYWRAPNHSKQWIVGRRDTLVLPTDIQYHRDHLGIVQNNFPDIIRLGDGDEVRDVPHPLSPSGLATYDFRIADSLRFELPGRTLEVYEVKVRPRVDTEAAAVGSVYLARDDAQVVRMAFSFTRAALRDKLLEDVSIILENSLLEGRYWLPRRQEIEIRRSGSWMDFPVKGIIRGRWEIRDYTVNAGGTEALAPGAEIVLAPPARRARFSFPPTPIVDSLPTDITLATNDDVRFVQEEARRLVRAQALARTRQTLPSARGVSDLVQSNRVEGIAIGAGVRRHLGGGVSLGVRARYGSGDRQLKGTITTGWERADGLQVRLVAGRDFRDAGDEPETSRIRNSIAAQEWGSDLTQPFGVRGGGVSLSRRSGPWRWSVEGRFEDQERLRVRASPSRGAFEGTLPTTEGRSRWGEARLERAGGAWPGFQDVRLVLAARLGVLAPDSASANRRTGRFWGQATGTRDLGRHRLVLRLAGGAVAAPDGQVEQERLRAGGPVSAPGYGFHSLVGTTLVSARAELATPGPFFPVPLGRWGRLPGSATWAPYAGVTGVRNDGRFTGHPLVGIGIRPFLDLVRVDVARGLRDGRWRFYLDVSRDFWPIL